MDEHDSDNEHPPRLEDLPAITTVEEVAACLRLSTKTIYRMIADGEFPARKCGGSIRLHRDTVIAWMTGET